MLYHNYRLYCDDEVYCTVLYCPRIPRSCTVVLEGLSFACLLFGFHHDNSDIAPVPNKTLRLQNFFDGAPLANVTLANLRYLDFV